MMTCASLFLSLQLVLYADAGFPRANEVHLRLGLIAKAEREFKTSLRHFRMAQVRSFLLLEFLPDFFFPFT